MLTYLFQMTACSGILYGYYHFFLRDEKFHQYNRFYLLFAMLASIILPLLKIPVELKETDSPIYAFVSVGKNVVVAARQGFDTSSLLYIVYTLIVMFFISKLSYAVFKIIQIKKDAPAESLNDIQFINTTHPHSPFSFFKWLFWNKNTALDSAEGQQIFQHEMYHIRSKHSQDLLFMEIILCFLWFNPFFYLYRKEVKTIQEFLADKHATENMNIHAYAELLLTKAIALRQAQIVNPFFHNQLKRRIAMLTSSKKPAYQWLRKLLVLPIATITLALFGFTYKKEIKEAIASVPSITTTLSTNILHSDKLNPKAKPITAKNDTVPSAKKTEVDPGRVVSANYFTGSGRYRKLNPITVVGFAKNESPKMVLKEGEMKIDVDAKFSGDWNNFLMRNIDGQVPTEKGAPVGNYEVLIRFIVNEDGSLSDFTPVTNEGYGMEEEVIRVLKKSPEWFPAINNKGGGENKKVKSYRLQPINFQVINKNATGFTPPVTVKNKNNPNDEVFTKVQIDAKYPGNWQDFIVKNLDGTVGVKNGAPAGTYTIMVQFIVDKNGDVSDVKAVSTTPGRNGKLVGYGMDEEAIRVIKRSGKWRPAIQNGREVKAYRKQPITFQITDQ